MKIDKLIDRVKYDLKNFNNPPSYMDSTDYIAYKAKADYAEDVLDMLTEFKEEGGEKVKNE